MNIIVEILRENPLLLLFLVAGIGYPLGRIRFGGTSLGVAAVLFVGLAFGALDPDLKLPEIVYLLGLVLFVYCIGLSSGSVFFASLKRQGMRFNLLVAGGLLFAVVLAIILHNLFQLNGTLTAGMYAGSLTNTPALAGVLEHVRAAAPKDLVEQLASEPVVAYSLTYPIGVLGVILAIYLAQRIFRINYKDELHVAREYGAVNEPLRNMTLCIAKDQTLSVAALVKHFQWNVLFGRIKRDQQVSLVTGTTMLKAGDLISLVGTQDALEVVSRELGGACGDRLEFDISKIDKRRIFVSNPQVVGRRLRDLDLMNRYGVLVTRLRRGDLEMIPHGETVLCLGDQVRVVSPHEKMDDVAAYLGDSYRAVSEIDVLTFSLGLAFGLLLGMLPIPLPGGVTLKLGVAGGPLIVALVLGAVGRTGQVVWELPYSANLTLRQIGLILFLAGVGTRSGYVFVNTLTQGSGLLVFAGGAIITMITAFTVLFVGYKVMRIPMSLLIGVVSGLQTQPAVLGFALEQTQNELPNIGYATVYPVSMILKILLAQVLLILFW